MLFVVKVGWGSVAKHTFVPSLAWTRTEIAALIAILGTTISPGPFPADRRT